MVFYAHTGGKKFMIYRKCENPKCNLCKHAEFIDGSRNIKCEFGGKKPNDYVCKRFEYDVFKRVIKPKEKLKTGNYTKENFEI